MNDDAISDWAHWRKKIIYLWIRHGPVSSAGHGMQSELAKRWEEQDIEWWTIMGKFEWEFFYDPR